MRVEDVERRRTLLLAVLLGDSGPKLIQKVAGRTGQHWGRLLTEAIPSSSITSINRTLGRWFVTKYGTKQGILVIGRVAPFGIGAAIGAGGNLVLGRSVIAGMRRAFGPPPSTFNAEPGSVSERALSRLTPPRVFAPQSDETASGKYGPLFGLLRPRVEDSVLLAFSDIDELVDGGLPPSARAHRAWWSNSRTPDHPHSRSWLLAGYDVVAIDLVQETVSFAKKERPPGPTPDH